MASGSKFGKTNLPAAFEERSGRAGSGLASCRSAWVLHPNLNQMALLLLVPSGTSAGFILKLEL